MSLGEAFIGIHADASTFKAELATQVSAALAETQATLRVSQGAGAAGTTTTNTVRTVTDDAALKAQSALQAQILRDELANQQVAAAAQAELETVRVAEAKAANDAIRITNQLTADQLKADLASQVAAEKSAAAERVATERAANDAIRAANAEQAAAQKTVQKAIADTAAAYKKSAAAAVEAGKTLSTVFTAPTLLIGAASVKQAFDFQQAVNKVINLSQGFKQTADQVTATVIQLSNQTSVSATELANAYYKIAAAGYSGVTAQNLLAESAKLSALGLGDSAKVADALVSVINNYGAANISAAKASSTFLSIIQNSKFTPDELAGSLGRVLAVAQQIGISFPEVGAAIAALSHSTSSTADTAVTGLQALITNLIQATKSTGAASKELKTLGLNGQGLLQDLGTKGVISTLDEIRQAFVRQGVQVKTTEAQYQDLATNLGESLAQVKQQFGKIDLGQLQKLFPNRKAFLTFLGLTDENNAAAIQAAKNVATGVATNVDDALKQQLSSPAGRVKFFLNQIRNDFITLGDALLPIAARIFGDVAKFVDDLKSKFDALSPSQKQQVEDFIKLAASIGPVLFVGGKLLQFFSELNKLLKANPIVILAGAFLLAYTNSKAFRDIVNGLVGDLKPLVSNIDAVKTAVELLGLAFLGLKIGQLIGDIGRAVTALKLWKDSLYAVRDAEVAVELANPIGATLALGAVAAGVAYKVTDAILGHFSSTTETFKQRTDDLKNVLGPTIDKIRQIQGPTGVASDSLHRVALEALGVANQMPGTGDKAIELGRILTQVLGLNADQAASAMHSLGFNVSDTNSILGGFSTASATNQLNSLVGAAGTAANAIIGFQHSLQLLNNVPTALGAIGGHNIQGPVAINQPGGIQVPIVSTGAGTTLGATGGGGGGGSKGPTAAQTAAANFTASIKSALTTLQDAIASFSTATADSVESSLESLGKSLTAAFKADKTTEPSALVKLLAKDTATLVAIAKQRDELLKNITAADSFATSTITAAQALGSLTTIASTLAIFSTATANLSKLTLVLPGSPGTLTGPAAARAQVNALQSTLDQRVAILTKFQKDIQTIIHEGLNSQEVQDLIAGGADKNGLLAGALAQATPAQIAALNKAQGQINAVAAALGKNAGDAAAQAGIDAGKAVADGILQGLKDRNASLLKAMTSLADALVNQIKKDLKIHSPSLVMKTMGHHIGTGLEHGILSTHPAISAAAAGMARSASPSLSSFSMPGGMGPVGGSSNSSFSPVATYNQQKEIHAPVTIHAYGTSASAEEIAAAHGRMIARGLR